MVSRVSVFCASSSRAAAVHMEAAEKLAGLLTDNDLLVQYGGGHAGLMGKLADIILTRNGKIRGIIPQFMVDEGWMHTGVEDMIVVKDMAERKNLIMTKTDGIIAMAGGVGTLEELTEAITLKQLGLIDVPIVILNTGGFYNELCTFFEKMSEENLIRGEHHRLWTKAHTPEEAVHLLLSSPKWDKTKARNSAAI